MQQPRHDAAALPCGHEDSHLCTYRSPPPPIPPSPPTPPPPSPPPPSPPPLTPFVCAVGSGGSLWTFDEIATSNVTPIAAVPDSGGLHFSGFFAQVSSHTYVEADRPSNSPMPLQTPNRI